MAWGAIIGGAAQIAGSLIGSKKRKREEQAAQAQQQADLDAVRNFQFTNPYKNLENTAEDLTVNQQASNFQAAQSDAALASAQEAIIQSGAGGGGGAAALVQGALASKQGISNQLAAQEQQNAQARVSQAAQNQQLEAQGEEDLQTQQYEQADSNLALSNSRLANAQAARAQATQQLVGGLGGLAGGLGSKLGKAAGNAEAAGTDGGAGGGFLAKAGGFLSKAVGFLSDRRFKKNIELVGKSPSGINIYQWEYLGETDRYEGVMADEVPHEVVDGVKYVNYDNLDVEFKMVDHG